MKCTPEPSGVMSWAEILTKQTNLVLSCRTSEDRAYELRCLNAMTKQAEKAHRAKEGTANGSQAGK
jgi:hypothetical protein